MKTATRLARLCPPFFFALLPFFSPLWVSGQDYIVTFTGGTAERFHGPAHASRFFMPMNPTYPLYLYEPWAMARDSAGNIYASDGVEKIYRYTASGQGGVLCDLRNIVGGGLEGITFGPDGMLYVAAYASGSILRVDQQGRTSILPQQPLGSPYDVEFSPDGVMYVANRFNSIYRFDSAGQATLFATNGLNFPMDMVFNADGDMFVSNSQGNNIYRFDRQGNGSLFAQTLANPTKMAFGPDGYLYVNCRTANAIQRFDPSGNGSTFLRTDAYGWPIDILFVPEPSSVSLLALGLAAVAARRRHQRRPIRSGRPYH